MTPFEPAAGRGWRIRDAVLPLDRTLVMGILNVTPDSFSDGGRFLDPSAALDWARQMVDEGADLIDVGGASTRPGAAQVPADVEIDRVRPVVERLAADGVVVSIDTMKPEVAAAAIGAGAHVVNDVNALRADGFAELCAEHGVGVVLSHMRGTPRTMQVDPTYDDVVGEVCAFLSGRVEVVASAGVDRAAIAVDPGIGFGKTIDHNLALLDGIGALAGLGHPVVIGTSRKSFLGTMTERPESERDVATAVTSALAALNGARILRVHNVPFGRDAARVADAMVRSRSGR